MVNRELKLATPADIDNLCWVLSLIHSNRHPTITKAWLELSTPVHANYPHQPGSLYDCAACESECFCGNKTPPGDNPTCCNLAAMLPGSCHTECVYCAIEGETL